MGRTKIELTLSPEMQQEFFRRLAQLPGGASGPAVQALAQEFGVKISHDAANTFRKGPLADYLKRLEKNAQKSRELVELAKANVPTSRANEVKLGMAISDKLDAEESDEDLSTDELEKLSRINARLRVSEDRSTDLERKLANSDTARDTAERRTAVVEKQLELVQFDAAAAAFEHLDTLKEIKADKTLAPEEMLRRAVQRMFGEKPAGLKPIGETHGQADPKGGKSG